MEIEKILHDLVQKTYLAGMMHGEGLLGSDEHKKMFEEGQELYTQLKAFLTPRTPDGGYGDGHGSIHQSSNNPLMKS